MILRVRDQKVALCKNVFTFRQHLLNNVNIFHLLERIQSVTAKSNKKTPTRFTLDFGAMQCMKVVDILLMKYKCKQSETYSEMSKVQIKELWRSGLIL